MPIPKILPIALSCVLSASAFAAKVPDIRSFGKPSAGVEGAWSDTLDFEDGNGGLDLSSVRFDAPLWGTKVGDDAYALELRYDWTQFDLQSERAFGEKDLHEVDLSARWAHFPKESGWIALVSLTAGVGTDFQDFNDDAWQGSVLAFWGYQVSPRFSWALAGYASYAIGEFQAYPSIGFLWTPSEAWRIQLTPPLAIVSYKPGDNWRFALSFLPNGSSWQVEEQDGVEQIDLSLWSAAASIERRLAEKFYVTLRAGVNVGGEVELRDSSEVVKLGRDLDPAPFVALGLRWEF